MPSTTYQAPSPRSRNGRGARVNWSRLGLCAWAMILVVWMLCCVQTCEAALVNVTLSRDSSEIGYEPQSDGDWRESWPGVRLASNPRSTASFSFQGTAIWYRGWLWSRPTIFIAQVDEKVVTLDLTNWASLGPEDIAAVPSTEVTVLMAANLTDTVHRVVLRKEGEGQREVIVGSFIYSTENPPVSPSQAPKATIAPSATPSSRGQVVDLKIIVPAAVGGAVVLALLVGILVWQIQRRKHARAARYSDGFHYSYGRGMSDRGHKRVTLTGAKPGVKDDDETTTDKHVVHVTPGSAQGSTSRDWVIE